MSDWASVLQLAIAGEAESIPAGFQTYEEIADEVKCCTRTVRRHLKIAVEKGTVERRIFRIRLNVNLRDIVHYRAVTPGDVAKNVPVRRMGEELQAHMTKHRVDTT